jgi:hypothetical protein
MMDQNEGVTEASQQLNASFPANGMISASLGLGSPSAQSRTNGNSGADNIYARPPDRILIGAQGYPLIEENHFRQIDLELVFKEAIKIHE